jgi:cyclopropane fatty-acyl-phospholipid synthase-like methyltransferase
VGERANLKRIVADGYDQMGRAFPSWNERRLIARERVPGATFVRGDLTSVAFRRSSFDGVVAFYVFMHVPQEELRSTFERIHSWLRPGGWLMLSISTIEAEDRVEEWLDVPMYFAGFTPKLNEQLLRESGFVVELSEIRDEVEERYGPTDFHWIAAKKPDTPGPGP